MRTLAIITAAALALPAGAQVTGAVKGAAGGIVTVPSSAPATTGMPPVTAGTTGSIAGGIDTNTATGSTAATGTSVGATGSSRTTDLSATNSTSATAKARAKSKKSKTPGVDAAAAGNTSASGNTGDLTTVPTPHR